MLALEVWIGNERVCLAGMQDWAIVSAHVTAQRHRESADPGEDDIQLDIGALSKPDPTGCSHHARWKGQTLAVGSNITIKVVETDQPDEPTKRYRSDHEVQENPYTTEEWEGMERSDYMRLKAKFEPDSGN